MREKEREKPHVHTQSSENLSSKRSSEREQVAVGGGRGFVAGGQWGSCKEKEGREVRKAEVKSLCLHPDMWVYLCLSGDLDMAHHTAGVP